MIEMGAAQSLPAAGNLPGQTAGIRLAQVQPDTALYCDDGETGHIGFAVIDPYDARLTHVVANVRTPTPTRHLIPVARLRMSAGQLTLPMTRAGVLRLPEVALTDFVHTMVRHVDYPPDRTLFWPFVVPKADVPQDGALPYEALGIRRGYYVVAGDGPVGLVDEFLTRRHDRAVSHLIMRHGHPWGNAEVALPIDRVVGVNGRITRLNLTRTAIGQLPRIAVERRWR